jgi:hypothetical protein
MMNTNTNQIIQKEEKIADGIYLTKPCEKKEQRYVYRSTAELINILENDFEEIAAQIKMLYEANEEMLEFDPNDLDLLDARQENLEIINRKLIRLKEIQLELKKFCPTNPLLSQDIFDYLLKECKLHNHNHEENNNNTVSNETQNSTDIQINDIVTEIEL